MAVTVRCSPANAIGSVLFSILRWASEHVRVRHMKRSHARAVDRRRVSCGQFGIFDLFFCWDPTLQGDEKQPLTDQEVADNKARTEQALAFFDGAVVVQKEEAVEETDFLAPFGSDCADTCHQELTAWDEAKAH